MKIGIIGSGTVGQSLGTGFAKKGHSVMIGTREPSKLKEWQANAGSNASAGTDADAAKFGELVVFCPAWDGAQNAIKLAGKENFAGKIVIDTTNPLLHKEEGKAPELAVSYPESAGKKVQEWLPESKVVKCFNTVTASYMCAPELKEGDPDMFIAGNDREAKEKVSELVSDFGWKSVIDIGGIGESHLLESLAMLWIHYGFRNSHWRHAFKLLKN